MAPNDGPYQQSGVGQDPVVVTDQQWQAMKDATQRVLIRPDKSSGEMMAYLMDPAGKPAVIPEAAARQALSNGYRPMADNEAMEFVDPTIHPGAVESFLLHGANKYLLGFPRLLSQAGYGESGSLYSLDEVLAAMEKENPTASTVGGLAGEVASAVKGPLGTIGAGIAGTVGRAVGKRLTNATIQRLATWGARGAAEGAVVGASKAVDLAHNPETSVNDVLASIVSGAAWGGVGGAGLSVLGSGARAVTDKVAARAAAKRYGALSSKLNEAIAEPLAAQKKVVADLEKHYTRIAPTATSPGAWAPPAALRQAQELGQQADDIAKLDWLTFRRRMSDPMSFEARAAQRYGHKATQAGNDQRWLVDKMQKQASELARQVDAAKTTSGVKVSQLEQKARDIDEALGRARQKVVDEFTETWGRGRGNFSPSQLLGQYAARRAVGMSFGSNPVGWMVSNLVGRPIASVTSRLSKVVNGRITIRQGRTLLGKGAQRGPHRLGELPKLKPRAPVQSPSLAELGKMTGKFSLLEAVAAASTEQIERQARLAGRQAQLTFNLPDAAVEPAIQANIRGMMFLQEKLKDIR